MEQQRTKKQIFLIFYIALFILVARMFYPYLTPLLWSGLIYSMTKSLFERCVAHIKPGRKPSGNHSFGRSLLAGIFAILGIVLIAFPIGYLIVALLRQLLDVIGSISREVEANPDTFSLKPDSPIGGFIYRLSQGTIDLGRIDLIKEIKAFLSSSSESIISYSGTVIKNFANMVINLAFMLFSLFFLYLDGKQLMELVVSAIPLKKSVTTMFITKIRESSHQLISGYFLVALYQGTAMFLISLAFGLDHNLVIGALTAVTSFVPMIGSGLVWLPLSIYVAVNDSLVKGIVFLVVSAFFVSVVDNFLRSKIIGDKLSIHPLLIFFAILGGIKLFGFNGLILGPLILIVFLSAISLYDAFDEESEAEPES